MIEYTDHPLLWPASFVARFEAPLRDISTPAKVRAALINGAGGQDLELGFGPVPPVLREAIKKDTRALLRHGGYKPSGRGKPSSEYLARAISEGDLPEINAAVDSCNALSVHSGLPISVVDLDLLEPPLRVAAAERESYVFNASGQEIQLDGLLCLSDATGPRANAVKDCHATKTHAESRSLIVVVWGPAAHGALCEGVLEAYMRLMAEAGAEVARVGPAGR